LFRFPRFVLDSFIPQRHHRINPRHPSGGQPAREKRRYDEQQGDAGEGQRIEGKLNFRRLIPSREIEP
jgi:hypothetical protein